MDETPTYGKTAVIGAGLMGGQIALILATGSQEVALMSRRQASVDRTMANLRRYAEDWQRHGRLKEAPEEVLARIRPLTSLEMAANGATFIVESVIEELSVKREIFARLDQVAPPDAILASNTSGLPITRLAEATQRPERVVGSHFIQPAHIVPVVEVVKGQHTSEATLRATADLWRNLGYYPLRVNVDVPGFLVNRLQHALIREATRLVAQGVASPEDVDLAVSLGLAPRFTTAGPLEQRDINGLETHVRVASYLWQELDGWEEPLRYLQRKVDRGEVGLEAGRGYYQWGDVDPTEVRQEKDALLWPRIQAVLAQLG